MNKIENDNLTQLVIDAQNGDAGAFEKLYKETIKFSYGTASLLLTNKEDIEDVLQNSYMYVSKYLKDLRNPESFTNWLKVIVKHECQKYISQNHKKIEIFSAVLNSKNFDLVEEEEIPLDLIEQREINQIVKEIVDKMPEDKRACIVLYYFERNTLPEIAEILGIPEGTVKSRLYKARKLLEKEFGKHRKKDERLLGISVIPLVTAFFASQFKNAVVPAALAEGTALAATQAASAAAATATATSAGMVAGGASAGTASVGATTAGAVATGAVVSETLGTTIAAKVVAVAVAAAVTTGGGVATVNYVNEKKNVEPTSTSTSSVTEEYATVAVINSETAFPQSETAAASEFLTESLSRQTEPGVTKPKGSTSAHTEKRTTARQTTTAATTKHTTTATTKPTTTRAHTTQTTAVKTTTTAVLTTNAADVFSASNGIIGEYTGSDSSVDVPSSVGGEQITAIGTGAFAGNRSIESVNIPSTVNRIGQSAFEDCGYLSYVSLPSSLESIGIGAFCNCTSLRNISIPSGTETIGDDAFADCSRLTSITIPSSVTSIGDNAFGGCDNLTIKCSEGSAAHSYAVENSIDYELI